MARVADIQPDAELERMLGGAIRVVGHEYRLMRKTRRRMTTVKVYRHDERPNTGLPDEFVDITLNGVTRAFASTPLGVFRGNLAVAVYCRTRGDGSVMHKRVGRVLSLLERQVKFRKFGNFFFSIAHDSVITPTTVNVTSGYSTTVLNVEWRMDELPDYHVEAETGGGLSFEDGAVMMTERRM